MANVVRQRQRFGEILVQPQRPRNRSSDLGDLKTMGQANAEMIAIWIMMRMLLGM